MTASLPVPLAVLRRRVLPAFALLVVAGCVARYFIDESGMDSPVLGALTLLYAVLAVGLLVRPYIALFAMALLPAMFGASPWNSPVKANIPIGELPLYVFDLMLIGLAAAATVQGLTQRNHAWTFIRRHRLTLLATVLMTVGKIAESGPGSDTVRNAALFYYFPATVLSAMWLADRIDLKRMLPAIYLNSLAFVALAQGVVLLGLALNHREAVLVSLHQGLSEPAGWLQWLPPGSLVLLSFCGAAFLTDRRTPIAWRGVIALLLVYDAVTYGNRAMWLGILAGLGAHWLMTLGWRKALAVTLVASASFAAFNATGWRDTVKEGHNESSEWRLLAWALTSVAIVDKPLIGHPYHSSLLTQVLDLPDSQSAMIEAALPISAQARSPHNSYLSLLFFGGAIQGGTIIVFVLGTVWRLGRALVRAARQGLEVSAAAHAVFRGTVAVIIYTSFNVVLETPIEGTTFWLIIAAAWMWAEHIERKLAGTTRAASPQHPTTHLS